jgi:hypothetical protein
VKSPDTWQWEREREGEKERQKREREESARRGWEGLTHKASSHSSDEIIFIYFCAFSSLEKRKKREKGKN